MTTTITSTTEMGRVTCLLLLLSMVSSIANATPNSPYKGLKLISVTASTIEQLEFLTLQAEHLDFWQGPFLQGPSLVLVTTSSLAKIKNEWTGQGLVWEELDTDVAKLVEDGMTRLDLPLAPGSHVIDHNNYHEYTEIQSMLQKLAIKYPKNVKVSNLPYKTAGYDQSVVVVEIHGKSGASKPAIIVESGIHAREWVAHASTLYFMETMLEKYTAGDRSAAQMLDTYTWHIVPVANPDGYKRTHQPGGRLWRKNVASYGQFCVGVDLNRNFDIKFGTTGVSKACTSDIYPGPKAFSEKETQNIRYLFNQHKNSIKAYVSIHAFGQYVVLPWTYSQTGNTPSNYVELSRVANLMRSDVIKTSGTYYSVGTLKRVLNYASSGSSMDWALSQKKNLYTFAFELRPTQNDYRGFNLPPSQIVPTGYDLYTALKRMTAEMK